MGCFHFVVIMGEADEVLSPPNEDAKGYVSAEFKEALTLMLTLRMRASLHFVPGSLKYPTIVLAGDDALLHLH